MKEPVRMARAIGALSIATALGAGLNQNSALIIAVIGVRLGRLCGLSNQQLVKIYYGAILRFIGCTANTTEVAQMGHGEEGKLLAALGMCDWQDPEDIRNILNDHFNPSIDEELRQQTIAAICEGRDGLNPAGAIHCQQAIMLTSRIPLPVSVSEVVGHVYDRWDGLYPGHRGDEIPIETRIVALSSTMEFFRRAGGIPAVQEYLPKRSEKLFDPALCQLVIDNIEALLSELDVTGDWDLFLSIEPQPQQFIDSSDKRLFALVYADYIDQKSGWLHSHSRQVGNLAFRIAGELGLEPEIQQKLQLAGYIHDIGRAGVPNRIWDKRGVLNASERREAERHSYFSELIMAESGLFEEEIDLAEAAHERSDSSGYPRRNRFDSKAAACLACADMYTALVNQRPWRWAMSTEDACDLMEEEVKSGRFPAEVIKGLFAAIGQPNRSAQDLFPAGLTSREVDVLGCLVRGMSNKEIAQALSLSIKTVENHLTSIYEKTGCNSRAPAALYALENAIFEYSG